MRLILLLLCSALLTAVDVAGTWSGGGLTVTLTPGSGGAWTGIAVYDGVRSPLTAREQGGGLVGSYVEAGETYAFTAQLRGTTLVVDTPDGDHYEMTRTGAAPAAPPAPAPAPAAPAPATPAAPAGPAAPVAAGAAGPLAPAALVGTWIGPQGTTVLRADGTGITGKDEFRWSVRDGKLHLENAQGFLQFPAQVNGDVLVLGSGPQVELRRAVGAAGTWYGWDGSVDPTMVLSVSHHIALLPDGGVAYAKGELDATRRAGWFSMRRENGGTQIVGQWQQQGDQVQFTLGTGSYRATFDEQRQTLTVHGMGQVNEGADVAFTRE